MVKMACVSDLLFNYIYLFMYVYICCAHMWQSEDKLQFSPSVMWDLGLSRSSCLAATLYLMSHLIISLALILTTILGLICWADLLPKSREVLFKKQTNNLALVLSGIFYLKVLCVNVLPACVYVRRENT